jgi:hypothetical protein
LSVYDEMLLIKKKKDNYLKIYIVSLIFWCSRPSFSVVQLIAIPSCLFWNHYWQSLQKKKLEILFQSICSVVDTTLDKIINLWSIETSKPFKSFKQNESTTGSDFFHAGREAVNSIKMNNYIDTATKSELPNITQYEIRSR